MLYEYCHRYILPPSSCIKSINIHNTRKLKNPVSTSDLYKCFVLNLSKKKSRERVTRSCPSPRVQNIFPEKKKKTTTNKFWKLRDTTSTYPRFYFGGGSFNKYFYTVPLHYGNETNEYMRFEIMRCWRP